MSAEVLREAAALMRERAKAADTHTPWQLLALDDDYAPPWTVASTHPEGERTYVCHDARHAGEHIASWHPGVALAVADWLEGEAGRHVHDYIGGHPLYDMPGMGDSPALAVARAYLGVSS